MIRVAICENDLFYMEEEKKLIESYFSKKKISSEIVTFKSSEELIKSYVDSFDIVFLDVEMDGMNGLEIARWIRDKGAKTHIIFISAYAEYISEGYKVDAHRYLLKNDVKFNESFCECMDSLWAKIFMEETKVDIEVQGGLLSVAPAKILYAESKVHRITIFVLVRTGEIREYYMYDRLDNLQDKLKDYGFIRIHQSYLINGKHLKKVSRYIAELSSEINLPISKKYYSDIENFYIRKRGEL